MRRLLRLNLLIGMLLGVQAAGAAPADLLERLAKSAPGIDPRALTQALDAMACASAQAGEAARRLAVIDYSLPSDQPRLWVFDLPGARLLYRERVAHGRGTGDNLSEKFSNQPGSFQSSLGLFRARETYMGQNGYSLRLDGLEPGINDRARERAIVIHGAPYVSDATVKIRGGVGRSHGCPAVRQEIARPLIDALKGGQYVFAWFPGRLQSALQSCPAALSNPQRLALNPASRP